MVSTEMPGKLTHGDYTVGWICSLEVEQIAALEMLDEEHERLPQLLTDHNVYNLGSIAGHNVVIVGLHQPGNNLAATVVTQMRMTFPNLRFGMLVGIGGGVPVKTDCGMIRLGDVVVSKPAGGHSGAVQYDHGKAKIGQFERTGALASPPAVLLNAAQDLAARRARLHKDPLEENIKKIDTCIRGLRRYKYPGAVHDYLYPSEYIHRKPGLSCAECGCDPLQRIQRTLDDDDEAYIVVHRGTIASGELVVKDARLRDTLAREYGVLCFETEAAGALADFPCIVIRGISDYCDSHKNDQWHGYAAVAAAAYARQLFFHMPIDEVKCFISKAAETDIRYVKLRQDDKDRQEILDWLTPVDYGPRQSDYLKMRQPGTARWLLDSAEYRAWLKTKKQTLFCPGIPGAGKTILTAVVVNDLTKQASSDATIGLGYIYCNFRQQDSQKIDDLMACLLKQLALCQSSLPGSVKDLYNQHKPKWARPPLEEILKALRTVATMYSKIFIIVDALDECQVSDGCRARFLSELFSLQAQHEVNIFATSRFIPQIVDQFNGSVLLEIRAHDGDVRQYLHSRIAQSESKVLKLCCEEIKTEITNASDGMFLLAQLHFDSIQTKKTLSKVKKALRSLPMGLQTYSYAYNDAMERIKAQDTDSRELAEQVLSWTILAKRHLTIAELQHAIAVEVGKPGLDKENIPQLEDMVSVCFGLVTVDEESNIIRLVHFTAQEYFERTWTTWFSNAQTDIAKICVTYLSFDKFGFGCCLWDEDLYWRFQQDVLYDYAARNWGHHACAASIEAEELILSFLRNKEKVSSSSQAMFYKEFQMEDIPQEITGLHLAAWFGLTNIILALLGDGHSPDVKDTGGRTPLSYAASNGQEKAVQLLLNGGSDINVKGDGNADGDTLYHWSYYKQTPLMYAARNGHEAVVRLLLESGADVDAKGWVWDHGDETNSQMGQTALMYAVMNGHEAVVRLLLDGGANVNAREESLLDDYDIFVPNDYNDDGFHRDGRTALIYAVVNRREAVVRLLLKSGADVNATETFGNIYFNSALQYAVSGNCEAIVKLLLAKDGVDVDGQRLLSIAANMGHGSVAKLLLEKVAKLDTR